jgi:L-ascorbate metabolism protein UlaG (beta-lactamase superfamily)
MSFSITYLGGPTALLEIGGLRLLTDPTFDPAGPYPIGSRTLTKTVDAVATPESLGQVDAVLLSHDQHPDNLDNGGRAYLAQVPLTLSTPDAQRRLGGTVRGLVPWASTELQTPTGATLTVTAVPALHGPDGSEALVGQVTGFVLTGVGVPTVYISGDNASLDVVDAVADRFGPVDIALLHAGAARTELLDGALLTLDSEQTGAAAVRAGARHVFPLHFEGWAHFSEGREALAAAVERANIADRTVLLDLGEVWSSDVLPVETT